MNALRRVLDAPRRPPHYAVGRAYRTHADEWFQWSLNELLVAQLNPRTAAGWRRVVAKRTYTAIAKKHAPHVCQ